MRRIRPALAVFCLGWCLVPAPVVVAGAAVPGATIVGGWHDELDIDPAQFRAVNASISLDVPDPMKAVADAERLVRRLGGEVESSNGSGDSARLSVRMGERRQSAALDALHRFPGEVRNTNRNISDFSQSARQSADRLRRLARANDALVTAFKTAPDDATVDGLTILRELAEAERRNLRGQLASLRSQAARAQLHVSFSRGR